MGGDLNLSLSDLVDEAPSSTGLDQLLDSGDLDMAGLMEGIESSAGEPEPEAASELSLDPQDLLSQIPEPEEPAAILDLAAPDLPEPALEPVFEPAASVAMPAAEEAPLPLADAALGAAVVGAAVIGASVVAASGQPAQAAVVMAGPSGSAGDLEQRLAELATQVMGTSVAVVRLEGKLAEREKTLSELEQRLLDAQNEAESLRDELSALRSQLEDSLSAQVADAKAAAQAAADKAEALTSRVDAAERAAAGEGERLALLEDRQTQLDREIFSEISRAVPREAARVIREEIAHLAASMRDE